ncbi:MAG: type II toxin-antitoxin system HipA family toxin [Bacteroides sp.]|mgnify:FL=1|uniref:HipA domain-containing protein n=1 Tax=Bacteroides difficilis TaxID=2763021 RepID=UPI003AB03A4B|nr:type II toxin-antitoxin system HipA family toxin [Bacteroides sp.]
MIEIKYCPSTLMEGFTTYSPKGAKMLFDSKNINPVLDFDIDKFRNTVDIMDAMYRISVSGVQEKFPAVVEKGKIRIAQDGERSAYILKPAPWDETLQNRKQIPANEHLTMQIASQVYGIRTADNGLCFTQSGQLVYITKRFDIQSDGAKAPMEDFATVIGRNEQTDGLHFKYRGCYEDIANAIRKNVAAWMVDMERFFELVLFNYIYANGDDHLKNFSLILEGQDYRLAPAYDLINTNLHVNSDDLGLDGGLSSNIEKSDVMDKTGHLCRLDFERFGERIGIVKPRLRKILDKYMQLPDDTVRLVDHSFLNNKMKRAYLRIVRERISRFVRISE